MQIIANKVVVLDYTLTDDEGEIIDASKDGQFVYLHGANNIIPGLECALVDKTAGSKLSVKVAPEQGYGERNDSMVQVVPKDMFDADEDIQVGQQFHAESPDKQMITITVTAVEGDQITIDGNHPLAGVSLNFEVEVIEVRDATEEELSHGHVHGPGGHQH